MRPANDPTPREGEVPTAVVEPRRRWSLAWILPVVAIALAAVLVQRSLSLRGVTVTVVFTEGSGIRTGDSVRYRGTEVGRVQAVDLTDELDAVRVRLHLTEQGDRIARRGARFWVVRPEIGLEGIAGLETLMGPHYVAVLPGRGRPQRRFIGLDSSPVVERRDPGDLEVIVRAPRQGSLLPGSPVLYRGIQVGVVESVGLTSDGSAVEARLHVEEPYATLVREESRFWRVGGVRAAIGISGVEVDIDSLPTLLRGGVAFATPPVDRAGDPVLTGHRFELVTTADPAWLRWEPLIAVGSSLLPPGATVPPNLRAKLGWRQGLVFTGSRSRQGWILPTENGVLAPLDLLEPSDRAREASVGLEIAGRAVTLPDTIEWRHEGLALADLGLPDDVAVWPSYRTRRPEGVEDSVAIGDPNADPLPLASDRLTAADGSFRIDDAIPVDESWHGAAVLSRADGKLLGILIARDDPRVVLVPDAERDP